MDSVVLCRSHRPNGSVEQPLALAAASECLTFHVTPTTSSGSGTSTELVWELIDIFESGMFAFPIYDHDSARDIVRYLLERGILEEEIADAIKDSAVDMSIWLDRGDKYMVGEWIIAWINACREDYAGQRSAFGVATAVGGYPQRNRPMSLDGSDDSLGRQFGSTDDDDDDDDEGDCAVWGGRSRGDGDIEEAGEEERCRAEICSTTDSFPGAPSYGSGLSFGQGTANDSNGDLPATDWSASSPPTPFRRLAPFLRRPDHPGMASGGLRRRAIWWRALNTSSLQHLTRSADEKSDSGIVSDMFDRASHDDVSDDVDDDDEEEEEEEAEEEEKERMKHEENCTGSCKASLCSVISASNGSQCSCRLPHYARFHTMLSNADRCLHCGKEKETDDPRRPETTIEIHAAAQIRGHYYKDFIVRALEYTLETLDCDGPGYLFVLADPEDGPIAWTDAKRFRVSSARHPELCVAAYRSKGIDVHLLWQVHVDHHAKMAADVQAILERHRLHSNWFRCTLAAVMDTAYAVISRHQATVIGCLDNEQ